MSRSPHVYLVCYDIGWEGKNEEEEGQKRLRGVYKTLRGFGDPLQKSIFSCCLSDLQLAYLKEALTTIIAPHRDQVLILHLGAEGARTTWRTEVLGLGIKEQERHCKVIG